MGGPRSVWDEKPLLIKTTGAQRAPTSVSRSRGEVDRAAAMARLCGWLEEQQSIGQSAGPCPLCISTGWELEGGSCACLWCAVMQCGC